MSQTNYFLNLSLLICANLLISTNLCSAIQSFDNNSPSEDVSNSSDLMDQVIDGDRSLPTKLTERLIDLLFRINWPALMVKLLKTLVEFMIDVAAGSFLGRSSLTSPLNSF